MQQHGSNRSNGTTTVTSKSLNQVEARKSVLVAEMTEEFMKEEKKLHHNFDNDPLLKLKSREVDLRAMENET